MDTVTLANGDVIIRFGVFDGHGPEGHFISQCIREEMLTYLYAQEDLEVMKDMYLLDIRVFFLKSIYTTDFSGFLFSDNSKAFAKIS